MPRRNPASAARFCLAGFLFGFANSVHGGDEAFERWAAAHAVSLKTVEPSEDFADLLPLKAAIGKARIVGLGESPHNTHEPHAFRNRLFRFLVEQQGFTAIALESGFTESINARPFIEHGEGDLETALQNGLPSGLAQFTEIRDLIQWMRDYNATASAAGRRQLRFYGIDLTSGARPYGAKLAIDSALAYLSRAEPATAQEIRDELGDSLPGTEMRAFGPLPAEAQAKFETSIQSIAKAMQEGRKNLIAKTSDHEYRWALHNLEVSRQLAKCLRITPPKGADMDAWTATMECRDSGMADNVRWALANEGRNGRLLVFAHSGHVMSAKDDGRRWDKARKRPAMMGLFLRRTYGKDMYVMAMIAVNSSGGFRAAKPMEEGSIESALSSVGLPLMFLDIRAARHDQAAFAWLSQPQSAGVPLDGHGRVTPSTALDAFLFIHTVTPAKVRP